jgi:hypothetical protein
MATSSRRTGSRTSRALVEQGPSRGQVGPSAAKTLTGCSALWPIGRLATASFRSVTCLLRVRYWEVPLPPCPCTTAPLACPHGWVDPFHDPRSGSADFRLWPMVDRLRRIATRPHVPVGCRLMDRSAAAHPLAAGRAAPHSTGRVVQLMGCPFMDRRTFMALVSGGLLAPLAARAQQPGKLPSIGYLSNSSGDSVPGQGFHGRAARPRLHRGAEHHHREALLAGNQLPFAPMGMDADRAGPLQHLCTARELYGGRLGRMQSS